MNFNVFISLLQQSSEGGEPPVELEYAARYWRLRWLDNNNSTTTSLAEIEFRAVADGPSIATGGTTLTYGDRGGSWVSSNAFDGDSGTFYSTLTEPPTSWVGYDFGMEVSIVEVMIQSRPTFQGHTPTCWSLEASDDAVDWRTIHVQHDTSGFSGSEIRVYPVDYNFDTENQRTGFNLFDTTYLCLGNQMRAKVDMTITEVKPRTGGSSRHLDACVALMTSDGRIRQVLATGSSTSTMTGTHSIPLNVPAEIKMGEYYGIFLIENGTSNGSVGVNYLQSGNNQGVANRIRQWGKTAQVLPVAGEVWEIESDGQSGSTGYNIWYKGSMEPDDVKTLDYTDKTVVFAIAGQSNAIGRGSDVISEDTTPTTNVLMFSNSDTLISAIEPIHHGGNEYAGDVGYGYAFAKDVMTTYNAERVIIVGIAEGGTGFIVGSWNPSNGTTYIAARDRWNDAWAVITAAYPDAVMGGVIWTQGEDEVQDFTSIFDDADDEGRYVTMTAGLFETMRTVWDGMDEDTPIIVTPIPASATLSAYAGYSTVQDDIAKVPEIVKHSAFVDLSGITETYEDTVHWDGACHRQIGPLISAALNDAHFNNWRKEFTSDVYLPHDDTIGDVAFAFDARGIADYSTLKNFGTFKEFDNKRVKVFEGAMSFDSDCEIRFRLPAGKPQLEDRDFSFRCGINTTTTSEQGIWSDYQTAGNNRSYVFRVGAGGILQFYGSDDGSSATLMMSHSISTGTDYELEVKRVGDNLYLYVDGVEEATYTLTTGFFFYDTGTESCHIGDHINGREFEGKIYHASLEFLS